MSMLPIVFNLIDKRDHSVALIGTFSEAWDYLLQTYGDVFHVESYYIFKMNTGEKFYLVPAEGYKPPDSYHDLLNTEYHLRNTVNIREMLHGIYGIAMSTIDAGLSRRIKYFIIDCPRGYVLSSPHQYLDSFERFLEYVQDSEVHAGMTANLTSSNYALDIYEHRINQIYDYIRDKLYYQ